MIVLFAAGPARADGIPPALVAKFRKVKALTGDFREEKKMAILAAPLVRSGRIAYEAPGRLMQETVAPAPSRVVLQGKLLRLSEAGRRTEIDVEKQPAVGLLVRILLGVLAGDVAALERAAEVSYRAGPAGKGEAGWTIALLPKDPLLGKLVKRLRFEGRGAVVELFAMVDAAGDETVTRFSNVKSLPAFSAAQRAALFESP